MVIDTSAVLAWLKHEPERENIVAALEAHPICRISAVSLLLFVGNDFAQTDIERC